MATKVVGSAGGAWIQSGANYGDPEEVWVSDADGARRIELPEELVNAKPSAFPFAELIQTEQDRWHTMGHDVPPYARLFAEMRARIENQTPAISERAATFDDAARGQAVLPTRALVFSDDENDGLRMEVFNHTQVVRC